MGSHPGDAKQGVGARFRKPEDGMKAVLLGVYSGLGEALARLRSSLLASAWGMDIGRGSRISWTATLDKANPHGVHIGPDTAISPRVDILAHDSVRLQHLDTFIGERCHIGHGVVICAGVKVGDGCIVAAGAVVTGDVPNGCLVVGSPAKVAEKNIRTGKCGIRLDPAVAASPARSPSSEGRDEEERGRIGVLS